MIMENKIFLEICNEVLNEIKSEHNFDLDKIILNDINISNLKTTN